MENGYTKVTKAINVNTLRTEIIANVNERMVLFIGILAQRDYR